MIREWYDGYGEREWERLEKDLAGQIKLAIHLRLLEPERWGGARVADVGCGPGRFALELARAGARMTLVDLSPVQLEEASRRFSEAGLGEMVESAIVADVVDLSSIPSESFDLTVCFGGPVSYAYDRHRDALSELARITRKGGTLAISVMCLWGLMDLPVNADMAELLENLDRDLPRAEMLAGAPYVLTRHESTEFHQRMALFTSGYMRSCLEELGLRVVRMAASNPVNLFALPLAAISASDVASQELVEIQLAMCEQPGLLDTGDHLVVTAVRQ